MSTVDITRCSFASGGVGRRTNTMVTNPLVVGELVNIKGGKYKGEHGKLLKLMAKMCKVRLESSKRDVNVYQSNVESVDMSRKRARNEETFTTCCCSTRDR